MKMALSPNCSACFCPSASSTSVMTTLAPSSMKALVLARPNPLAAPVTIAILPSSSPIKKHPFYIETNINLFVIAYMLMLSLSNR